MKTFWVLADYKPGRDKCMRPFEERARLEGDDRDLRLWAEYTDEQGGLLGGTVVSAPGLKVLLAKLAAANVTTHAAAQPVQGSPVSDYAEELAAEFDDDIEPHQVREAIESAIREALAKAAEVFTSGDEQQRFACDQTSRSSQFACPGLDGGEHNRACSLVTRATEDRDRKWRDAITKLGARRS